MIIEEFSIEGAYRLKEFESFLTQSMKNSSLRVPVRNGRSADSYRVTINCDLRDAIKLESLFEHWKELDKRQAKTTKAPFSNFFSWLAPRNN